VQLSLPVAATRGGTTWSEVSSAVGEDARGNSFREMVRRAGIGFFPLEFVAKLPLALTIVGVLSLVTVERGSIADAGITSGILGLASAICAPLIGLAADRWGQRRVLMPVALVNGATLLLLTATVYADPPLWGLFVVAVLVGASSPQIGPMGRARWIGMMSRKLDERHLSAAMGWESMTDEIGFIVGPLLVGVLTSLINPAAPVIAGAVIVFVFAFGFAIHPTHAHAPVMAREMSEAKIRIFTPRIVTLAGGMVLIGLFWGVTLVTVTDLAEEAGLPGAGGFVYGAMGGAASISALATGLLTPRITLPLRWVMGAMFALLASLPLLLAADLLWIGVWFFFVGVGLGPVLVTLFTLAAELAPLGRGTTVMTIVSGGSVIGQAAGTSGGGVLLEQLGAHAGFIASVVLLAVLTSLAVGHFRLTRAPAVA